jgi:hypothetical protein
VWYTHTHIHTYILNIVDALTHWLTQSLTLTHSLTHGAEPFLRSCKLCSYSRTSQHCMEPEGLLPCSHEPSHCPPTYMLVFLVVSLLLAFPPVSYIHSYSTQPPLPPTVNAQHVLFIKKPFIVSIMSAKSSGRFENAEVTCHLFSAATVCSLKKGREVGKNCACLLGPLCYNMLYDGSCKYRTWQRISTFARCLTILCQLCLPVLPVCNYNVRVWLLEYKITWIPVLFSPVVISSSNAPFPQDWNDILV